MNTKILAAMVALAIPGIVGATGYIVEPPSRAAMCKQGENETCGKFVGYFADGLINEKAKADFPDNGKIASAGLINYSALDNESIAWKSTTVNAGKINISWQMTSPTIVKAWKYYLTNQNWQSTHASKQQLTRESFESTPFCTENGDTQSAVQGIVTHQCQLPKRHGHQVIYAVADLADGAGTMTNVIDVNVSHEQDHASTQRFSEWKKEIATIDRPLRSVAGKIVKVRFFDDNEIPALETSVSLLSGEETDWSYAVARAINSKHQGVKAGVRQPDGNIVPVKGQINSIYVTSDNQITRAEIDLN